MSGQVGRNDPCPCGSGKKYKKCCMLKNAVSITALLEKDAAALHNRIIDYAVTSYSEELTKDFQEKVEYLIIKDRKKELEFYILAHSIWFIFFKPLEDGTTIMERFIREKGHTIRRRGFRKSPPLGRMPGRLRDRFCPPATIISAFATR